VNSGRQKKPTANRTWSTATNHRAQHDRRKERVESKHQRTLSNQQRRREERLAGEEDCDRLHLLGDFGIQPDEDAAVSDTAKNDDRRECWDQ
jgi:hypothetical protein